MFTSSVPIITRSQLRLRHVLLERLPSSNMTSFSEGLTHMNHRHRPNWHHAGQPARNARDSHNESNSKLQHQRLLRMTTSKIYIKNMKTGLKKSPPLRRSKHRSRKHAVSHIGRKNVVEPRKSRDGGIKCGLSCVIEVESVLTGASAKTEGGSTAENPPPHDTPTSSLKKTGGGTARDKRNSLCRIG